MIKFSLKSFRSRYLLVAVAAIFSTLVFITLVESYIRSFNQLSLQNVAQRLKVTRLNTELHSKIQTAARMLDLYLFTPSTRYRKEYLMHIYDAKVIIGSLSQTEWIQSHNLQNDIQELKNLQQQLYDKSLQLLQIRLDGEKMYPAMSLANGSMRNDNIAIITLINAAINELQANDSHDNKIYSGILELRDQWRRTINAYRLYLVNRLSSLSESTLTGQSTDIRNFHQSFINALLKLSEDSRKNAPGIETETALNEILPLARRWLKDFNVVDKINMTEAWRADVPIILKSVYPVIDQFYSIINKINSNITNASSVDIQNQHKASEEISYTLWGVEIFLIILTIFGYFILDYSLLKPLSLLSSSLRDSSNKNLNVTLPNSNTQEIQDFVKAYQHMQEQINTRQEKLEHIAMHDSLTNLPNRSLLIDHISIAISNSQRFKTNFAVIILDLDRFKEVNDTLGHLVGDEVLKQVAERLLSLLRNSDTVARLGGDEFALLLTNIEQQTVTEIASKISHELEKVYVVQEHNLYLGASLGVSIYPEHGLTKEVLLKNADVAMYMAKNSDLNYIIYAPQNDKNNIKQLALLSDLRQAIDLDQLKLYYQPIYITNTNTIIGYEALIRWIHPEFDLLTPDNFIQLAEQTGLIKKITLWVIETALVAFKSFPVNHNESYIAVNVTAWDLQDSSFTEFLTQILNKHNIDPHCLILELSERSMMTDSSRIQVSLNKIKDLGVRIAIDDFGTGFSSLALLQQLPVSVLKIDKSFVLKMASEKNDSLIVHSIVDLAHNLELKVIAEGVEDTASRDLLKKFNCDYCQGYLFSMPLSEDNLLSLLEVIQNKSFSASRQKN